MKSVPTIKTQRLSLRGIEEQDTEAIVKMRSNPDVFRYFLSPHKITTDEHLAWFQSSYIADINRYDWIAINELSKVIGLFGVKRIEDTSTELSYLLDIGQCGKGYATEAVNAILQFCISEWHVKVAVANVHKDNESSIKFIERLGFSVKNSKDTYFNFIRYEKILQ